MAPMKNRTSVGRVHIRSRGTMHYLSGRISTGVKRIAANDGS